MKPSVYVETSVISYYASKLSKVANANYLYARRTNEGVRMYKYPIVAEVRKVREQIAAEFGYDHAKLHKFMMEYQKTIPNKIIRRISI